ncbi:MAG: serine/threonine-protein kinase [Planctomycetota bacterium]
MPGEHSSAAAPILDRDARDFVKRALAAGVVTVDEIKKVVASLMTDDVVFTPKVMADGLVGAGMLTPWQSSKLLAGKRKGFFLGPYKLLRPLGRGGMGMVYLGEHHVMKRQVALKIMSTKSVDDERRVARFKEEARASAQIDHPNVVQAIDFNSSGGKFYIVMEYVDGVDLHHAVVNDGVMAVDAAVDAVYQAARGIAHAHDRGIIHRDIKPSNLMLRNDGIVKVSDMGLARVGFGEVVSSGDDSRLTGTADFIAPEQAIDSRTVDARADIYSLGCTLYFLLAGRPPFEGQTLSQRVARHQTAPIPNVRVLRPECPSNVATLITKMMAKQPADRPASVLELISQLERLRGGSGSIAGHQTQLAAIASVTDTTVEEGFYRASIEDTSFSDSNEPIQASVAIDEFDFDSIPTVAGVSGQPSGASAGKFPEVKTRVPPPIAKTTPSPTNGASQMVLLGIGLTVAVMALMTVLAMAAYTLTRPMKESSPTFKATEGDQGEQIVIMQSQR